MYDSNMSYLYCITCLDQMWCDHALPWLNYLFLVIYSSDISYLCYITFSHYFLFRDALPWLNDLFYFQNEFNGSYKADQQRGRPL
jgi:hypothetical protein